MKLGHSLLRLICLRANDSPGVVCGWQIDSLTNVIDAKNYQLGQLQAVLGDGNKSRLAAKKELEDVGEALQSVAASMCNRSTHRMLC